MTMTDRADEGRGFRISDMETTLRVLTQLRKNEREMASRFTGDGKHVRAQVHMEVAAEYDAAARSVANHLAAIRSVREELGIVEEREIA